MNLGDINTIGDVTQTIHDLLDDLQVTLDSPANLQAPAGQPDFAMVNLYLYQVVESAFAKNQPWVTRLDGDREYPPLALHLYYLLTPYASDALSAHRVLTHAMRQLYINSTLTGPQLVDSLRNSVERLTISLCQRSLEELTRIWNALQTPYRLSVCYEVRVVLVESMLNETPVRVAEVVHALAPK